MDNEKTIWGNTEIRKKIESKYFFNTTVIEKQVFIGFIQKLGFVLPTLKELPVDQIRKI